MKSELFWSRVALEVSRLDKFSTITFIGFFVLGSWLGHEVFMLGDAKLFFYQFFSPEVFAASCGKGWFGPGVLADELHDFLLSLVDTFDCGYFDKNPPVQELGLFTKLQWYLNLTVKIRLSEPTLNYADLWPLPTFAMGIYASGCFVFLRLFLSNLFSVIGAMVLVWSPLLTSTILSFRDFSKAPFVIWIVIILVLLLRSKGYLKPVILATAIGCLIGVGSGFRSDVGALLPIAIIVPILSFNFQVLKVRCLSITAMYLAFTVSTLPMSLPNDISGGWGTIVQQGMSRPFKDRLKLEHTIYELGWMYSDELSLSSIAASERPLRSDWDENESQPRVGFSQAIALSGEHVSSWMLYFAGDLLTQAVKSTYWIMAMPAVIGEGENMRTGLLLYPSELLYQLYGSLNSVFMAIISALGLLALFMRSSILRPAETLGLFALFAGLLAMPSLQYSLRHAFHLEFLSVIGCLSAVSVLTQLYSLTKLRSLFIYVSIAFSFVIFLSYFAAREYQRYSLKRLFVELLALPRDEVPALVDASNQSTRFSVKIPEDKQELVDANIDSLTSDIVRYGNPWDVRASADRMLLTMEGCPSNEYLVRISYNVDEKVWQNFSSEIRVSVQRNGTSSNSNVQNYQVLFPAFYRPTQYLSKVSISPAPSSCSFILEKLSGVSPLPYLVTAVFSSDWNSQKLFYGFGRF